VEATNKKIPSTDLKCQAVITKHIGCVKDTLDETKQDHSSTECIGPRRTALEAYILSAQEITGKKFTGTTLQALDMGTNKILGFTTPNMKLNARDKRGLPLTKITKKETQFLTILFLDSFLCFHRTCTCDWLQVETNVKTLGSGRDHGGSQDSVSLSVN